jgi:glyoxylase-like metal-dependent hydrolase (beta-lactamase superfamily II)
MNDSSYEVYAIKYAQLARKAHANFIDGDPHETADMPLNYYVWVIVGRGRAIVIDTGFGPAMAKKRGRTITKPVEEGLRAIGVQPQDVQDVVITHMHYDHCGNDDLFTHARYHLQDLEMDYATGRCMCHREISKAFEADDVARMVHRVFDGRVRFHDGTDEIAPGVTLHHIGGHTKGLQVVRVDTDRGAVVLASDATHFYAHMEQERVFPILYNLADVLDGYRTLRKLASSERHVIPGHDPLVMARYPAQSAATEGWVARLDVDPGS